MCVPGDRSDTREDDFRADQDEQIMRRHSCSWWMEGISHLGTQKIPHTIRLLMN